MDLLSELVQVETGVICHHTASRITLDHCSYQQKLTCLAGQTGCCCQEMAEGVATQQMKETCSLERKE